MLGLFQGAGAGENTEQTVVSLVTGILENPRYRDLVDFSDERIKPSQRELYGPGSRPGRGIFEPHFVVDGIDIHASEAFNQV